MLFIQFRLILIYSIVFYIIFILYFFLFLVYDEDLFLSLLFLKKKFRKYLFNLWSYLCRLLSWILDLLSRLTSWCFIFPLTIHSSPDLTFSTGCDHFFIRWFFGLLTWLILYSVPNPVLQVLIMILVLTLDLKTNM